MWQKLAASILVPLAQWFVKVVYYGVKGYIAERKERKAIDAASEVIKDRVVNADTPGEREDAARDTINRF